MLCSWPGTNVDRPRVSKNRKCRASKGLSDRSAARPRAYRRFITNRIGIRVSTRRRLFYESRLLTLVGDHKSARVVQSQALEMYPACVVGDPALMMIDQAAGLVAAKEFEAGAALAADTVDRLPPAQRGRMFLNAARSVVDSIPRVYRGLPDVQASRDAIAELEQSSSTTSAMPDNMF